MLQWLRKSKRSWFIALTIGAIVVVFIFWGIGGFKSARFEEAASVNGAPILLPAYAQRFNQLLREQQERAKGELTDEDVKLLRLKERALNMLIEETLIQQAGDRLGLAVSTPELQERIRSLPYFQEDGHFSLPRYQAMLTRARLSPADFEAQERRNLLMQKLIQTVTAFAKVSEGELEEFFRLAREEVNVSYLSVSPEKFISRMAPTDAELTAYYQERQGDFKTPDRVRVRYALFKPGDFLEQAKPAPQEVAAYLKDHSEEFSRAKVIQAREIFLAAAPNLPPAKRQEVEKRSQNLLRQARGRADFARLAQALSDDLEARKKGGDLGDVKRNSRPESWEKVAFNLKPGEVGLAQTPKGFHLIKVEEVRETEKLPEAEAKNLAAQKLKEDKARRLALEAAQRARGEVSGANFPEVAKKYRAAVKETPLFALPDSVPDLGASRAFNEAALALGPQELSKAVELPQGFALIEGLERRPAATPPLEQVKDQVRLAVARQQAKGAAEKEAGALLEQLKKGEALTKVAAQAGLPLNESGFFTRPQGFLKQPLAEALTTAAFQLTSQHPYPAQPLLWKDAYYLLAFKARRPPSPEDFKKEKEKLQKEFLEHKRQLVFEAWLTQERQRAKIKIYETPS